MTFGQKSLLTLCVILFANTGWTKGPDIMLLSLYKQNESYEVGKEPVHITQRDGYDNQPKFTPDGDAVFFTRMQGVDGTERQQSDIYRYSIKDKVTSNITQTNEHSEYSATPYGKDSISIIGVNPQGQQHLRKVNLSNASQKTWRKDIEPVGYHAWLNETKAAVFVLGDVMTLQILDTQGDEAPRVLAENIGRCLQTVRNGVVSFTVELEGLHHLKTLTTEGRIEETGIILPEGVQDYIWLDNDSVLVGKDSQLLRIDSSKVSVIADLEDIQVQGITRLAINPGKTKLALVYDRP